MCMRTLLRETFRAVSKVRTTRLLTAMPVMVQTVAALSQVLIESYLPLGPTACSVSRRTSTCRLFGTSVNSASRERDAAGHSNDRRLSVTRSKLTVSGVGELTVNANAATADFKSLISINC
jgi:hypothetical protein